MIEKDETKSKSKPLLVLKDVTVGFGEHMILNKFNWKIDKGQQWAITGPNGSGKTILIKTISRKIMLIDGEINYFFQAETGFPFFKRNEIIVVSPDSQKELLQQYGGYYQSRWMSFEGNDVPTVSEILSAKNIEHISPFEVTPLAVKESIYIERRNKAIALLNIEYLLSRKVHQLSNGETRKVMIARALMQSPSLLVLDDPFYGLDTSSRQVLSEIISELLVLEKPQLILITSRPEEIPSGITHVLEIKEGIATVGLLKENRPSPKNQVIRKDTMGDNTKITPFNLEAGKNGPPLIEMENVTIAYQDVKILTDINWKVNTGEHWAIIGHNGAGKTTLLSLIMGDNPQSYAQGIKIFGKERGTGESVWEIKQRIGWVAPELQNYFSSGLNCLEVVCSGHFDSIGLYQKCTVEQIAQAKKSLWEVGAKALAEVPFNSISTGEQRLVLIARALSKNPAILILDEPCQGLDEIHRQKIIGLLDRLCQKNLTTLIMVTHQPEEIPCSVTHILQLTRGLMEIYSS